MSHTLAGFDQTSDLFWQTADVCWQTLFRPRNISGTRWIYQRIGPHNAFMDLIGQQLRDSSDLLVLETAAFMTAVQNNQKFVSCRLTLISTEDSQRKQQPKTRAGPAAAAILRQFAGRKRRLQKDLLRKTDDHYFAPSTISNINSSQILPVRQSTVLASTNVLHHSRSLPYKLRKHFGESCASFKHITSFCPATAP